MSTTLRRAISVTLSTALLACGGSVTSDGSSVNSTDNSGSAGSTALSVGAGAYSGTVNGFDWFSALLSEAGSTKWYALHLPGGNADLYSGLFSDVGTPTVTAGAASLALFSYVNTAVRSGSGSIGASQDGTFSMSLNFPALSAPAASEKSITGSLSSVASTVQAGDLSGTWRGYLYSGFGNPVSRHLTIQSGTFSPALSFMLVSGVDACVVRNERLTPLANGNVFSVSLNLETSTGCPFYEPGYPSISMSGVAAIAGSPKTLFLMAVKTGGARKGEGFAFRGTQ